MGALFHTRFPAGYTCFGGNLIPEIDREKHGGRRLDGDHGRVRRLDLLRLVERAYTEAQAADAKRAAAEELRKTAADFSETAARRVSAGRDSAVAILNGVVMVFFIRRIDRRAPPLRRRSARVPSGASDPSS